MVAPSHRPHFAAVLLVLLIVPQITFQDIWLLRDPAFDVKYQASAQPFLELGMLVTARPWATALTR